ncbi:MAG: DNA invertase Pin-like site-specific DNA recombinase [Cognaticolwellia sp.]|jgi:DNA invertase Pin-like site-specific DNA recombinase
MKARAYLRASTKEQDSRRAEELLSSFAITNQLEIIDTYFENYSGTKLNRPVLNKLLLDSSSGEVLLVESVDRLSRLSYDDFDTLKRRLSDNGLRLVVVDLPTTHMNLSTGITGEVMRVINNMLIDLMATMARLDQEKRIERIKQGMDRAKIQGKRIGGRGKNKQFREQVEKYLARDMTAQEISKLVGCGVATVYRVQKEFSVKLYPK